MKWLILLVLCSAAYAQSWPSQCRGKAGMSLLTIKRMFGTGGAGPVPLGNTSFLERYKECNDFTGCGDWVYGWTSASWPQDWRTKKPPKVTTPQLMLMIDNNALKIDFVAPYVRGSSQCYSGKVAFSADLNSNVTFAEVDVGYLDSSGGYGCQPRRFKADPSGSANAKSYPFTGVITNTCAQFGSGEMRYTTKAGYGIYQSILYSKWPRPSL